MKKLTSILHSLPFTLAIRFALTGIVASAIVLSIAYFETRGYLFQEKQNKLLAIASNAAMQIDGDDHAALRFSEDSESETYRELQRKSFAIAATDDEIIYVYTMRKNEAGSIYFILDAGREPGETPEEYEPGEIGSPYENPSDLLIEKFDTLEHPIVEPDFYTDEFGTYLSAYAPLYRSDGQLDGIIGIDILSQDIVAQQSSFLNIFVLNFAISSAFLLSLGWVAGNLIAKPIRIFSQTTSDIKDTNTKIEIDTSISEVKQLVNNFNSMIDVLHANGEQLQHQNDLLDSQNEHLQKSIKQLDRRARQFEAITQVLRAVTSLQNLDTLLPLITQVISQQFGIYHTGIFLLDNQREYAVLRAANSPGGQTMLARGHKLKVGQTGIVGFVTATGQSRIALDVGIDAVFFNNPDLPNTRSEMALPLRYAGQIIGALDVQSVEPNAFGQDDLEALTALADQVAIAINNVRTLEEARRSLMEAQSAIGTSTRETWQTIRPKSLGLGVQLRESTFTPLEKPIDEEHVRQAVERGEVVISKKENEPSKIAIPIRLRGQVIGVMNLQTRGTQALSKDHADLATAVAERLSLALETATLIQATQHRANIERITSEISSRIGLSTRFETILQTAAQELSRALGGSDVLVQIEPVAIEMSSTQ
jgi:GAF domain-containing protein